MGDHFVLLVDRLITASTLEAAIESRNLKEAAMTVEKVVGFDCEKKWSEGSGGGCLDRKLVECRICQDEDYDCNMEAPCACCGSLKYAHRKCIQRWCNEKGDTICEICHQPFKPGYTAPPQMFHYGGIPMNFRGSWEITRQNLHNPQFIAMVATDRNFLDNDFDDYAVSSTRSALCCRSVAVIFMVLLILRHALPILIGSGLDEYASSISTLFLLRTAGILIPAYLMVRGLTFFHRRRRQQQQNHLEQENLIEASSSSSEDESDQSHPHVIHIR